MKEETDIIVDCAEKKILLHWAISVLKIINYKKYSLKCSKFSEKNVNYQSNVDNIENWKQFKSSIIENWLNKL